MQRVGAADTYCFDRSYYAGLRVALGDRLDLVTVAAPGGQTVAAGLVMVCGSIAQYHLSGSDPAHAALAPTKLLLAHAIAHVRERSATHFHLGGGVGGREDSLFAFKAGFSAERARFATLRIVLDPVRYHALCARWSSLAHEAPSAVDDFFPAYRRPIVTGAAPGPSVGARP